MSERRCATEGCPGTLPEGVGKHCPRCGGTEFAAPVDRRRSKRWVALLLLAMVGIGFILLIVLADSPHAFAPPAGRAELVAASTLANRMTSANTRDEAYADIIHRALLQHDIEYACQMGVQMTTAGARDKQLLTIVEEALKSRETKLATRAADAMVNGADRDAALKRIMAATAGK